MVEKIPDAGTRITIYFKRGTWLEYTLDSKEEFVEWTKAGTVLSIKDTRTGEVYFAA